MMELLRTIAYPPGGGGSGGGGAKGCEAALGRAAGGESRRKKAEEQQPPHQHQHAHPAAEVSRIITDPTTGKRYCRGKVLGKVMAAAGPPGAAAGVVRPVHLGGAAGAAGVRRAAGPRPAGGWDLPRIPLLPVQPRGGSEPPSRPRLVSAA